VKKIWGGEKKICGGEKKICGGEKKNLRRLPVKKSHVRNFSGKASHEKISREIFSWQATGPQKSMKNAFQRYIFLIGQLASEMRLSTGGQSIGGSNGNADELMKRDGTKKKGLGW